MKKLESNLLNMVAVMTISTLLAAGALGAVFTLTEEPIQLAKEQKRQEAIKVVLPKFTQLAEPEIVNGLTVVRAYNNDEFAGAAVESSANGFGGDIKLMVGFDAEGNIVNYSVLEQHETPGLGTKIVDWFKADKNRQNICGLNPSQVNFTVSKDGGEIDAITSATISSRAFLAAIQSAYQAYANNSDHVDSYSGATTQAHALPCDTDSLQTTDLIDSTEIAKDTLPEVQIQPTSSTTKADTSKNGSKKKNKLTHRK